ncbi:MAG TPA: DUF6051 family protein [Spirochaetia bacterium]|nr:DUF6051 family protein [Spirochaetia bacterium]
MGYFTDYSNLKQDFRRLESGSPRTVSIDGGTEIVRLPFESNPGLPGNLASIGRGEQAFDRPRTEMSTLADASDASIRQNREFDYYLLRDSRATRRTGLILLFHGLNERMWDKYLPWAQALNRETGKSVILFPIAFHMNRAPDAWSSPRAMNRIARERRVLYPSIHGTSFANAALSTRLQADPKRFLLSGYQTLEDVVALVRTIRAGRHSLVDRCATIDFFGYSIGAFLTEFLLLGNPGNLFAESRAFLFCGGAALNGMNPVSRYIMDSEAGAEMNRYFSMDLGNEAERNPAVRWIFARLESLALLFRSLVATETLRSIREACLQTVKGRIRAVALARDLVVPAKSVKEGLSPDPAVQVFDFAYPYTHEQPFPLNPEVRSEVEDAFVKIFSTAVGALAG